MKINLPIMIVLSINLRDIDKCIMKVYNNSEFDIYDIIFMIFLKHVRKRQIYCGRTRLMRYVSS